MRRISIAAAAAWLFAAASLCRGQSSVIPRAPAAAALTNRALAGYGLHLSARASMYQRLSALFKIADAPEPGDVNGWRAGRGFASERPNQPYPSLLVGETLKDGAAAGGVFKLVPVEPVGWTDADALMPRAAADIDGYVRQGHGEFSAPRFGRQGADFEYKSADTFIQYDLRKWNGLLILRMTTRARGQGRARRAVDYCYYFKDVTPAIAGARGASPRRTR